MSMISPCPRYNSNGIACPALPPGQAIDYNESSPIASGGVALQPICKYTTPWPTLSASWVAGQSLTVVFDSYGSPHNGGHCEWSVSFDSGNTFAVVHRVLSHCFYDSNNNRVNNYTFALPADLPSSGSAVFSWSWINASGNREFYMNCADVSITGSSSTSYTGPQMVIANYPGYPMIPEFE
ncbi:hypothetical protein H4R26_004094, partial [Coemansia thaxteri]